MNVPSPLAGEGYTSASKKRDGVRGWCGNPEFATRREPQAVQKRSVEAGTINLTQPPLRG